jgi:O-methyltransferase
MRESIFNEYLQNSLFLKMKWLQIIKDFLLYTGVLRIFSPLNNIALFVRNFNRLNKWIRRNNASNLLINDFYVFRRNYTKRLDLYRAVSNNYQLDQKVLLYLEFGVASGQSFIWWLGHNVHPQSRFYGFDTFEGLPEKWGSFYKKGDMAHEMSGIEVQDSRANLVKGTFQQTLANFNQEHAAELKSIPKLIHLDADLFSSTIFVLSQLYPFLNKGDIILFDEFNVANHEYFAFQIFTDAFYVNMRLIAAQNNFYQTAFVID